MLFPRYLSLTLSVLTLALAGAGATAAASGTHTTTTTTTTTTDTQKVIAEVRAIADKARQQRSADPWMLQAMDNLVAKYDHPWSSPQVNESFQDRDYIRNPAWEVKSGNFWVDTSLGLRSQATAAPANSPAASESNENAVWANLMLGLLLGNQAGKTGQTDAQKYAPSVIMLPVSLTNAFAVDLAFSQHRSPAEASRVDFVMLDGTSSARGYSLSFRLGPSPHAILRRVQGGKADVIQKASLSSSFATGSVQTVNWRRRSDGNMTVLLNGQPLIQVTDRGGGETYKRLALANRGGDFAVRQVIVASARS